MTFSTAEGRSSLVPEARTTAPGDGVFPERLRSVPSPPKRLWFRGRLPQEGEPLYAVVGARKATGAGCERAHAIAAGLGRHGAAVISGGAFGVDAAAHEGALAAGASTYAVLGCGVDVVYPDRHAGLFARIAAAGGLFSEYPPGTRPRACHFPARNRLIAGSAEAVVVAEAALRSGALITAGLARKMNRPLLAVPGSPGTDALLRAGHAWPATSAEDVLSVPKGDPVPAGSALPTTGPLGEILDAIAPGSDTPAELCERLGMALPRVLSILAEAEVEGLVKRTPSNTYEVIGRAC